MAAASNGWTRCCARQRPSNYPQENLPMIEQIIAWSARNKFYVFLGTFFAIAWGIWAAYHTPLDAIPDLSDVQVIVFSEWKGRSPESSTASLGTSVCTP